jgi:cell division protein FtsB
VDVAGTIQQCQARVRELDAENAALKAQIKALETTAPSAPIAKLA